MKILVVGGTGTIGKKVSAHLKQKHEVIIASKRQGDVLVDMANSESIEQMYQQVGTVDAIVCIAGDAKWGPFSDLSEADYYIGLRGKLMGQVNLVRIGQNYLNPKGSFTLTTGILAEDPVLMTASAAMVNGGIHSFVKAVALELDNGHRINVVAAGLVEDAAEKYQDYFPGHLPVAMPKVVNAYVRSIEGRDNGKIIRVYQ